MVSAGSAFLLNSFNPGIFFVEKFLLSLISFVTYIVDIDLSYIAAIFLKLENIGHFSAKGRF